MARFRRRYHITKQDGWPKPSGSMRRFSLASRTTQWYCIISAWVLHHLGVIAFQEGDPRQATTLIGQAIALRPDYADAYSNLGSALVQRGRLEDAAAAFRTALELKPDHADAHNNLGNVLKEQGKLQDAVIAYRRALALTPDHVDAYVNLGITLIALGRRVEALEAYRRALAIRPGLGIAQGMFVHMLQHACDWGEFETAAAKLDTLVDGDLDKGVICAERPFVSITRCDDAARNLAIAESWSTDVVRRVSSHEIEFAFDNQRLRKKRIRIGYLTADFHAHATAHLMAGLFGLHDRDRFTIHAYSYGPDDKSAYRARIAADSDAFADIRDLSTTQSARRIYQDEIDILVDLKGYSQESRLDICALRPAPVQATYLGFPGTTGADFFDYVITDRIVTPEDQVPFYSENFVYLPHCYQVNDHTQAISNAPVTRADCGLPEDGFVFCSFNQSYKIEPLMWDVWMRILRGVPGSVLWLLRTNKLAEANLKREAVKRDVDPGRIVFADFLQNPNT